MKRWKQDIRGIGGLNYIVFKNVPMRESKWGEVIELNQALLEKTAASAIIGQRVALRGAEVNFLRKTMGLSLQAFAEAIHLSDSTVFKWEAKPHQRLHAVNEAAVRAYFAEALGVEIPGKLSSLLGDRTPEELVLKAG